MRVLVLVLASQKGGAGKTTLAIHLSVAAEATGAGPVVMIDADPQGTLTTWRRAREGGTPALAACPVSELSGKLGALQRQGYRLAIIDTPPSATASIRAVIAVADLVLVPVRPSPADLWSVGATLGMCRDAGKPFAFALTQATRGALVTAEAVAELSEHGAVSKAITHNRVGYATALTAGLTIQEVDPRGPGAAEVAGLLTFVTSRLSDRQKGTRR